MPSGIDRRGRDSVHDQAPQETVLGVGSSSSRNNWSPEKEALSTPFAVRDNPTPEELERLELYKGDSV